MNTGATLRVLAEERPGIRPEIQALRAIAVLLVVIYHLWPLALPGGYVGVDVFFVISGFLITAHLLREVERTGRVRFATFWARRARRLLPASLLVITFSAIGTLLLVPVTFWRDFFKQMAGAVTYVLNWLLASDAVDYLAAENNPSPVQHYWSLSVEEQFYIVWPILIAVAALATKRIMTRRGGIAGVLALLVVLSFGASVVLTTTSPESAYFVTTTRAWEFGLGGLVAFLPTIKRSAPRVWVAWIGAAGIVATGLIYTATTPFPGYTALLPVLSTAAVIWAGSTPEKTSLAFVSRFRPVQYLGDISYSLYLWHWPLIVFAPYVLSRSANAVDAIVLLALAIALAAATKRYVEDPVRSWPGLIARMPRVTLLATAGAMVVALVLPATGFLVARSEERAATQEALSVAAGDLTCVGAGAIENQCDAGTGGALVPGVAALKADTSNAYECFAQSTASAALKTCSYGPEDGVRVAVTGDSHGAMLLPGLLSRADELGWRIDTYVGQGCTWASPQLEPECTAYRSELNRALTSGAYDLIIFTAYRFGEGTRESSISEVAEARADVWTQAVAAGTEVVVVGDNPKVPDDMVDCVVNRPDQALRGDACVLPLEILNDPEDPLPIAAKLEPRVRFIDLNDLYCSSDGCPMVIGDIVVYRDQHHLTATYSQTITPVLLERMASAIPELVPVESW